MNPYAGLPPPRRAHATEGLRAELGRIFVGAGESNPDIVLSHAVTLDAQVTALDAVAQNSGVNGGVWMQEQNWVAWRDKWQKFFRDMHAGWESTKTWPDLVPWYGAIVDAYEAEFKPKRDAAIAKGFYSGAPSTPPAPADEQGTGTRVKPDESKTSTPLLIAAGVLGALMLAWKFGGPSTARTFGSAGTRIK